MCVMGYLRVVQWLHGLYFHAVVDSWRGKCFMTGVEFRYKHGCKLVGDRTAKSLM